jgi:hypothetical protein
MNRNLGFRAANAVINRVSYAARTPRQSLL